MTLASSEARSASRDTGVDIGVIVAASRMKHPLDARTLARLAASFAGDGPGDVVGFGLSNDERVGSTASFAPAFRIARRAGRIAAGFDAATGALIGRKAHAVFLTTDCAPRTERNVRRIAEESGADVLLLPCTQAQLGYAIGCPPTGVLALTDPGFLKKARVLAAPLQPTALD